MIPALQLAMLGVASAQKLPEEVGGGDGDSGGAGVNFQVNSTPTSPPAGNAVNFPVTS